MPRQYPDEFCARAVAVRPVRLEDGRGSWPHYFLSLGLGQAAEGKAYSPDPVQRTSVLGSPGSLLSSQSTVHSFGVR